MSAATAQADSDTVKITYDAGAEGENVATEVVPQT